MPMDNSTVKRNILNIRESLGLSQEKMADRLDICRNTYRNIEKGSTKLISDAIPKIAELCGKSPEEIVLGYIPVKEDGRLLQEERERMQLKMNILQEEYQSEIDRLRTEIEHLKLTVERLQDNIRTKDDIIGLLQKQLGEK